MVTNRKHKLSGKVWIEHNGKPLIGKGGAEILEAIAEENSISKAAEKLRMSYRYVWNYIKKIERTLDEPIVETHKGGKTGGGGAKLTVSGQELLNEYRRLESCLIEVLKLQSSRTNETENKRTRPKRRGTLS
jgi:molybdate transport system regulatory protein